MKKLQKKGLGETDQSAALIVDEIFQILDHESMSGNDNESLVRHVFFWLSLLCGLRGGDTAKLKVNYISRQPHGGLFLVLTYEKNNQHGALKHNKYEKSAAKKLPITLDNSNNRFKPVYDILKMIFLRPLNADNVLFLETYLQNGIWFKTSSMGEKKLGTMMSQIADLTKINLDNGCKITNHSLRRTAIQRLKDLNIPEDERIEFSGHRSHLPYEEFNYFPSNSINYLNFENNPEIYNDSIFMTAAENYTFDNGPEPYNEYSDSSNSSPILPPARSNYDKRSTFRSCIPRLSSHRSPLKSVSNQAAPYYIPTFHDIKKLHKSSSDSNNKQEIHYHFHYHL
ncbi:8811_t:CDS:2 [Cetraspora pellucida]|uniref:8811_t:CDS:1 n=1 Tax=Cetraspora pellucida TaxID=1433469 RepID=A0A9N9FN60_9GLOM|nr:8811_t:CDS:2 [Cetraspora pellucida]